MMTADTTARAWYTITDSWVVTLRNVRRATRIPEMVVFAAIQPVMLVLLLAYVFGNAIKMPEAGSYRELLIPGIRGGVADGGGPSVGAPRRPGAGAAAADHHRAAA